MTTRRLRWLPALFLGALLTRDEARALQSPSSGGLRGDSAAIEDARAMVEAMGGLAVWREVRSLHFVHEWDHFQRIDRYLENEILDLTAPRSYVTMESELYERVRAYSEIGPYWNRVDGRFEVAGEDALAAALERAPFSLYRIARAVAVGDAFYAVRYGPLPDVPGATALEFHGPDDRPHGWILLNRRKEPMIWATTQYAYSLGPLERYGNVLVPRWGATGSGRVRYEMRSLIASRTRPDSTLFLPPS